MNLGLFIIKKPNAIFEFKPLIFPKNGRKLSLLQIKYTFGLVAQLVEQLTLNQWVQGSSPCQSIK